MNWNTTAGSNNEAAPDGAPENMAPSGVNNTMREMMARIKEMQAALPWIDYGKGSGTVTFTFTSSALFEVEGADVTAAYTKGRRIKAVGTTTGTIYGTIDTSTFTVNTKVYVDWDSGFLNNETLSIQLGLSPVGLPEHRAGGALSPNGFRNWLINGDFDIWQRLSTLTASVLATEQYIADRWALVGQSLTLGMTRRGFTVGQTDVPDQPQYYAEVTVGANSGSNVLGVMSQYIEGVRTLSGKNAVISFYAKGDAAGYVVGLVAQQNYGTAGAATNNTTLGATTLTDTWKFHQITSAIPAVAGTICATNNLRLTIVLSDGGDTYSGISASTSAKTISFSHFQIEEGTRATPFEKKPYGLEHDMCQRYFQKTGEDITPLGGAGTTGQVIFRQGYAPANDVTYWFPFHNKMRTTPTVALRSTATGNEGYIRNVPGGADVTASATNITQHGFRVFSGSSITAATQFSFQWSADADF
jgi:hypothetical protein